MMPCQLTKAIMSLLFASFRARAEASLAERRYASFRPDSCIEYSQAIFISCHIDLMLPAIDAATAPLIIRWWADADDIDDFRLVFAIFGYAIAGQTYWRRQYGHYSHLPRPSRRLRQPATPSLAFSARSFQAFLQQLRRQAIQLQIVSFSFQLFRLASASRHSSRHCRSRGFAARQPFSPSRSANSRRRRRRQPAAEIRPAALRLQSQRHSWKALFAMAAFFCAIIIDDFAEMAGYSAITFDTPLSL